MDDDWFGSMRPSFDGRDVTLAFFKAKQPTAQSHALATLRVAFAHADGRVPNPIKLPPGISQPADPQKARIPDPVAFEVTFSHADRLSPTMLQRFAWARWLSVAEAIARAGSPQGEVAHRAFLKAIGAKVASSRPGPKGHPPEFYEQIALRYSELLKTPDGRHATTVLADELSYNRNTMAGMVRRARDLFPDLIPTARPGRAG